MNLKTTMDKVNEGLSLIQKQGGRVSVKDTGGTVSISGVVARFYFDVNDDTLTVNIVDKPWLASESMIEQKINEFFLASRDTCPRDSAYCNENI